MHRRKSSPKFGIICKRFLSASLVGVLGLGMVTVSDMYYGYSPNEAFAAELALTGQSSVVSAPVWNPSNIPSRDRSGTVTYYYAGNGFHALNQLNDGPQQAGSDTNGHLMIYSDSYGARLVETNVDGKMAVKGNFSGGSDFIPYVQRSDIDFDKTWELMDTDAVWDNGFLYTQYQQGAYAAVTSAFTPTILSTVNGWYDNNGWFSDAEKSAVRAATVKTDGVSDSANTNSAGDTLDNAHLFAASIDELYYNPVQVAEIISNLAADTTGYTNGGWQLGRSYLWSRSFWGAHSYGNRHGFNVHSYGQVCGHDVAVEFAVAPAFYLDLEEVVMARSANAGASATANSELAAYDVSNLGNEVKFLLKDNNFAPGFTSSINGKQTGNIVAGHTYTVDYSGASTSTVNDAGDGAKLFISAAIYDTSGNLLNYGPVAEVTGESGSVDITIPSTLSKNGNYILELFEEQIGGVSTYSTGGKTYTAYETDYMSAGAALMNITISADDFDVTVLEDAYMYSGRTYTGAEIAQLVNATIGANTLTAGDSAGCYFVFKKSDFEEIGTTDYNTIVASAVKNRVEIPQMSGDGIEPIDLVFIYYSTSENAAQVVEKTINVHADTIENNVEFDAETWYKSDENGIEWNYKLNAKGDIIGLYATDTSSITGIVDAGSTLNVPSKVAGRTVVGIGSGDEAHPFIPASETSWTSISFPSTVAVIQDFAFYGTQADANIVIPSHITNVGIKAFQFSAIKSLKINDMNGTIGSLAFADTANLDTVTIKGSSAANEKLVISTIAFRDSKAKEVSINGNVDVNKNAFKNNEELKDVFINGNVSIKEYAFSGCRSIEKLNIPNTVKIDGNAFNNCTGLTRLEIDSDLVNNAFSGCNKISLVILGDNVKHVAYDWDSNCGTYATRTVYVRSKDTLFEMKNDSGTYKSSFGSAGDVKVYVIYEPTSDQGTGIQPNDDILSLNGYTCFAHKTAANYQSFIKGSTEKIDFKRSDNIDDDIAKEGLDDSVTDYQTGIDAYYSGSILTTTDISKDKMTVLPIFGSKEGQTAYGSDEFCVIRTNQFNNLVRESKCTPEEVAKLEPIKAVDADLRGGSTGTISATVIVFYESGEEGSKVIKYFHTPVSIRVEEYSAESYVEQKYGSYDNIVKELEQLSKEVDGYKAQIDSLTEQQSKDTAQIEELTTKYNTYLKAYNDLLEKFGEYVESTDTDETGYFGTITDEDTNEEKNVVFIGGIPVEYQETEMKTSDGKTIYSANYDVDGDGTAEEIKFFVDKDGVHLVDDTGSPIVDDTGSPVIYSDPLEAVKRQLAGKLTAVENSLKASQTGLNKVIKALEDAGFEFSNNMTVDESYKKIVDSIEKMEEDMQKLDGDLNKANTNVALYENAVANIYALLTNSDLKSDNIQGVSNAINAVTEKISTLKNNLGVANATISDLTEKLATSNSQLTALSEELETTKSQLDKAKSDIAEAEKTKTDLQSQYEKALAENDAAAAEKLKKQIAETESTIDQLNAVKGTLEQKEQDIKDAQDTIKQLKSVIDDKNKEIERLNGQIEALSSTAEGYKLTVNAANQLFGLDIPEGSSVEDIQKAVNEYVKAKVSADDTIAEIQKLIGSNKTGDDLVNDVRTAVANGSGSGNVVPVIPEGYIDDSTIYVNSNNYKAGYLAGADGKTSDKEVNVKSESYKSGYSVGYNEGYVKGLKEGGNGSSESTEISNLKSQLQSLTNQVSSLTSENSTLRSKVNSLESNSSNNAGLQNQVNSLSSDVSSLRSSNSNLQSQVSDLNSKNSSLSSQVSDLSGRNTSLSSMVSDLQSKNSSLSSELSSLKAARTTSVVPVTTSTNNTNTKTETKTTETKKVESEDELEGSTNTTTVKPIAVNGTLVATEDNKKKLGTTSEISMFRDNQINTIAPGQFARGNVIKFTESNPVIKISSSNGKGINDISEDSLNNIYKILSYYANHIEELGNLGSDDVKNAAADESKAVVLDVVAAGDILASTTQEAAFANLQSAKLELTFPNITNGALYLIVHERSDRTGQYEVCLTTAASNNLSMNVSNLSPVVVAKVQVKDASSVVNSTLVNSDVQTLDTSSVKKGRSPLGIILIVMLCLCALIGIGIVVIVKLKEEERLPEFLSFLYGDGD